MVWVLDNGRGRPSEAVEAARTDGGMSALQLAAANEQLEVCSYLAGVLRVDVDAADDKGLFLSKRCLVALCENAPKDILVPLELQFHLTGTETKALQLILHIYGSLKTFKSEIVTPVCQTVPQLPPHSNSCDT